MTTGNIMRVLSASVPGRKHRMGGTPNQDAIAWVENLERQTAILCLSDGHGNVGGFRSDRGSRFAVQAALHSLEAFIAWFDPGVDPIKVQDALLERVPREIVRRWRDAVASDLFERPFKSEEMSRYFSSRVNASSRWEAVLNPVAAYGATLLAVFVCAAGWGCLQLGDGDILVLTGSDQPFRPVPVDERCRGVETTSLCLPEAWRDFRAAFLPRQDTEVRLILAATDGYANSFKDEAAFFQAPRDWLRTIRTEGVDEVEKKMPEWLADHSAMSGDDVTLGLIVRELEDGRDIYELNEGDKYESGGD
ncbi:MAG: PP2C family serine/threonine-protein phosphatase [Acidobacteriota bacterium]|nr:PP2C family serine/threonine-protein phosphatase [Acidobacteriota bacterium]